MLIAIIVALIWIIYIANKTSESLSDKKRKRLIKEVEEIKRQYPLAFAKHTSNFFWIGSADTKTLERLVQRSNYDWHVEEQQLIDEKKREQILKPQYEALAKKYPNGLSRWKRQCPGFANSIEVIISCSEEIAKLEKIEKEEIEKRKSEDEFRRKAELAKYKSDKDAIVKVLQNNGIRYFYHFTARENLTSIKRFGGLYSWYSMQENKRIIPCSGGDDWSHQLDMRHGLQDYVRLSFCDDHPMAFRLKQSGTPLVLLKIDIEVATWKDTLFSDINAADNNHRHGGSLADLNHVNFNAVKRNYVSREDADFKPHQAEVMVKTFIPTKYILNLESPIAL